VVLCHSSGGVQASEESNGKHGACISKVKKEQLITSTLIVEEAGTLSPISSRKRHKVNSGLAGGLDVLVDAAQVTRVLKIF
jgi:hypothetical protein